METKLAMPMADQGGKERWVRWRRLAAQAACAPLALAISAPLLAQAVSPAMSPAVSQPVVQSLPSQDSLRLSAALSRLGRDPRDIDALVDAGNAAVAMGDLDAGVGFFKRAAQVSPRDSRAKVGMASALVRGGDPASAIPLFDEAERAGALPAAMAADRGLAYDLVGDNVTAQKFYRTALAAGSNDEVSRRLALSIAIMGDARGVEEVLSPQLRAQDKAAWRTRAFAFAILGRTEEAVKITRTILPEELATQIAPYLRYMPQLTPAQQAAAADLGMFPRASEIGRDDPRIALYAPPPGSRPRFASVDAGLVPKGAPLGKGGDRQSRKPKSGKPRKGEEESAALVRVAPTVPRPERQVTEVDPALAAVTAARPAAPAVAVRSPAVAPPAAPPAVAGKPIAVAAKPIAPPPAAEPAPTARSAADQLASASATATPAAAVLAAPGASASAASPPAMIAMAAPITPTTRAPVSAPATSPAATLATSAASVPATTGAAPAISGMTARPGFDLSSLPAMLEKAPVGAKAAKDVPLPGVAQLDAPSPAAKPSPEPAARPAPPAAPKPSRTSLADAFSDLGKPEIAPRPAPGAVDITRIKPAKPQVKPDESARPVAPSHPSRIWVQIGVGRDKGALTSDWRKAARKAPELFKDRKGHISDMGASNRLLAGPFESARAANAFIARLRDADIAGAYVWTSPAGQVVDAIAAR